MEGPLQPPFVPSEVEGPPGNEPLSTRLGALWHTPAMAFWCYILKCSDGRYYTGHTDDLERRIAQHQAGGYCQFTARRQPVVLMWAQEFATRIEALEAERRISPWSQKKKEALIARDWAALSYWARPPGERPSTSLETNGGEGLPPIAPIVPSEVQGPASGPTP